MQILDSLFVLLLWGAGLYIFNNGMFGLSSTGLVLLCCRYWSVSARRALTSSEEPDTLTCTLQSPTAAAPTCVHDDQTKHFICQNTLLPARKCAIMKYDSARFGMKWITREKRRTLLLAFTLHSLQLLISAMERTQKGRNCRKFFSTTSSDRKLCVWSKPPHCLIWPSREVSLLPKDQRRKCAIVDQVSRRLKKNSFHLKF